MTSRLWAALWPFERRLLQLAHAQPTPRPYPADRYLRALALGRSSCDVAEVFVSAAIAKSAIIDQMREDVRELLEGAAEWSDAAAAFAELANVERPRSAQAVLQAAMRDDHVAAPDPWRLTPAGRWERDEQ